MPDEPTLGEAHRRIDRLQERVDNRVVSLNTYKSEREHDRDAVINLSGRIKAIEEKQTWIWRTAVTAFLFPIIVGAVLFVLLRGQS